MLYSHSRLSCFEDCPRCFQYRYISKVPIEYFETVEQFMGSRVHESLEKLYKDVLSGKDTTLDEVLDHFNAIWDNSICDGVVVNSEGMTHSHYLSNGMKCLADYYHRHYPFQPHSILACELRVNVDLLGDGNYKLLGFIDRVDSDRSGRYDIHDYKTGSKLPSQNQIDKDRQLAIYEMGLRQMYCDIKDVEYNWHYLAHDKHLKSRRNSESLDKHKREIIKSIHSIEEAIVNDHFPKVRTPKCSWCEYQGFCAQDNSIPTSQKTLGEYSP
jgi:putative RecB family exonuclease